MATYRTAGTTPDSNGLGPVLVRFTTEKAFPDETISSLKIKSDELPAAIKALDGAKAKLQQDIHQVNQETADDVNTWYNNAKVLQDDINRSKQIANDIIRQSEEPETSGKTVEEAEARAAFLIRELNYNDELIQTLRAIKAINTVLDEVEQACAERRIVDALRLLEQSWAKLDSVSNIGSTKAIKLLNVRAFELKSDVHQVFDHVWNSLVHLDDTKNELSVQQTCDGEPMNLSDAVIGLKAYKEVDKRMTDLWLGLDRSIIGPRMNLRAKTLPAIKVGEHSVQATGQADKTVKSLFSDLTQILEFLAKVLPSDLVQSISAVMMPEVTTRLVHVWLDSVVPSSLAEMAEFEPVIASAREFCESLLRLKYESYGELQEWVDSAPKVYLAKCRAAALDSVRVKLTGGLGPSKEVERVETQTVTRSEGKELAASGPSAAVAVASDDHGWDSAWSDHEDEAQASEASIINASSTVEPEDDGADAWGAWGDDDDVQQSKPSDSTADTTDSTQVPNPATKESVKEEAGNDEADGADAWGWGDEDTTGDSGAVAQPASPVASKSQPATKGGPSTREMTLKETYYISSMPDPVLSLIFALIEDGASLTQESHQKSPVVAAAAGLFSVPTLVLAMFRAIAPYYYTSEVGGNMYLYNDASYLAEKLGDFASSWKARDDLTPRARNMLRIENDIKALQGFANRAYSNEMNTQKMIVKDLLGGEQSVMQRNFVEAAIDQVRSIAGAWDGILAKSAWFQAVGSLVDAVSTKVIKDVMDMPSIGADESYNIASMIDKITGLDDLFPPIRTAESEAEGSFEIPSTSQYVPSWLRLGYLSQVLQSNLRDLRYLWIEGELSLYFTLEEVLDLIDVSFEDNSRTREVVKEIKANPQPIQI
ncbi:hypothetical protein PpBr36_07026 [Pyricularia pennisetigena]|uniref:hypothetical protein n=1 Tax=Pyricularia pennisetigena TaxID=1578925 RepID=UPI0011548A64|nr:hypothetical protein PpBr36_07026 [Pyricularia pennisetigena]TLS25772.1 hypothetical protein PpBr36_07026 [Pyricularia pennisetigena]